MEWMLMPLRRYAQFDGRSRRKEYWMFTLLNIIVVSVLVILALVAGVSLSQLEDPSGGRDIFSGGLVIIVLLL